MMTRQTTRNSLITAIGVLAFSANLFAGTPLAATDVDPFEQGRAEGKMFAVILFVVAAAIFAFVKWRKRK